MRRALALVAGSVLLLSACGQPEVGTDELESQIATQLQQEVGRAPDSVSCDEALPAEVGASVRCELTAGDSRRFGLTAETTEIDGDDVRFSITVDEDPAG